MVNMPSKTKPIQSMIFLSLFMSRQIADRAIKDLPIIMISSVLNWNNVSNCVWNIYILLKIRIIGQISFNVRILFFLSVLATT